MKYRFVQNQLYSLKTNKNIIDGCRHNKMEEIINFSTTANTTANAQTEESPVENPEAHSNTPKYPPRIYASQMIGVRIPHSNPRGPDKTGFDKFREVVLKNLSSLIFRRVAKVVASEEDFLSAKYIIPDETGSLVEAVYERNGDIPVTEAEIPKNVEMHYKKFFLFTQRDPLRTDTDKIGRQAILCRSDMHGDLDMFENVDFRFSRTPCTILPREGDLLCILPVRGKGGKGPEAKFWFVCSEQWMRTWTLITQNTHETLRKLSADESILRRKVFSGNHTMTNGYRKWLLSCEQSGFTSDYSELEKRFWILRSEKASIDYVHMYSALVLMLRYGELPSPGFRAEEAITLSDLDVRRASIPNNLDNGPFMYQWDLPENWLEKIIEKYQITEEYGARQVELLLVDPQHIPKGTTRQPWLENALSSALANTLSTTSHAPTLAQDIITNEIVELSRDVIRDALRWGDVEIEV